MAKEYNFFEPSATLEEPPKREALDNKIREHAKRIIEALLFASSDPLSLDKIKTILHTFYRFRSQALRSLLAELSDEYNRRHCAFTLEELAGGYILRSREEFAPYLAQLNPRRRMERLSPASVEVLAVIAFRQPITRTQIETIRGVDCSGVLQHLLERDLIEPVGRLEAPGRPVQYATTSRFLQHFGLKDLQSLSLPLLKG